MASSTLGQRIVFTGGSGKAGRHVIPYLLSRGHEVLNLDLTPLDHPSVYTLKTDLTDAGQVFNAFTSHFHINDYSNPRHSDTVPVGPVDAVIHFAAYARNMLVPDNECFKGNVLSTYNVIEAACKLGIKKIIIASSETTYGVCFTQGDSDYHSFPLEEDYDCGKDMSYQNIAWLYAKESIVDPMDTYATSKLCGERCARSFARRFPGTDIYALRIGNVIEPHEYERDFPEYVNKPETRKRNAWSYIDARDLGQICDLCIKKDGMGFQVFNATNTTSSLKVPTMDYLMMSCPNTPITREMGEFEAPLSNRKAREVLGFKEEHPWYEYVKV
jgi:nucleoside-diphosphate-sugar epimerase